MSDPANPEHAGLSAFGELELVIRHVTEQLAVFRRRALSAESLLRDQDAADAVAAAQAVVLANATRASQRRIAELEGALLAAEQALLAMPVAVVPVMSVEAGEHREPGELARENALLRERLQEAAERTRQISERVRFLRQQLSNGGEK